MTGKTIISLAILFGINAAAGQNEKLVWPPAPDEAKIEYVGEIDCTNLSSKSGLFGKLKELIGGRSAEDMLSLPFDVLAVDGALYMTCQNFPALVRVNQNDNSFEVFKCESRPMAYPIALCAGKSGVIYITDSEGGAVYRFQNKKIEPFITSGLTRPTGIAYTELADRLFVVDTGDHTMKIFDSSGNLIKNVGGQGDMETGFNFPTFVRVSEDNNVILNDALNYKIRLFDTDGNQIESFGEEGDGPGAFSRPKGVASDSRGHIYVVDNLFDNIQIFDHDGRILLVIGSAGQDPGQFWSPSGIDIVNDTIYVADTFNNRIQMLHYLGGSDE